MIDGLKIIFNDPKVRDKLLEACPKWLTVKKEWEGRETEHKYKKIHDFHVNVYNTGTIVIHGSIHKYIMNGWNNNLLTLKQLDQGVNKFSSEFFIPLNTECIKSVELGVNIPTSHPDDIVKAARTFHGKAATIFNWKKNRCCYKEWDFNDYSVKLYRKGLNIVRLEIKIKAKAKKNSLGLTIFRLNDLIDRKIFIRGLFTLYEKIIKDFIFIPDIECPFEKYEEEWKSWQRDSYWEDLLPEERRQEKKMVRKMLAKSQWNFMQELQQGVLVQGSYMLGIPCDELSTIFSTLRLSGQKVAGPQRVCDCHTENEYNEIIPVNKYPVVRNIGYYVDVIILALSYHPMMPRGPPAFPSLFL